MSPRKPQRPHDLAERIYRRLADVRGMDDAEHWQHALFLHISPGTMPLQDQGSPLSAFLKALDEQTGEPPASLADWSPKDCGFLPF